MASEGSRKGKRSHVKNTYCDLHDFGSMYV